MKASIKEYGLITSPSSRGRVRRLFHYQTRIEELVLAYRPDLIIKEEMLANVQGQTSKVVLFSINSYHTATDLVAYRYNIPMDDVLMKDIKVAMNLKSEIPKPPKGSTKEFRKDRRIRVGIEKKHQTIEKINKLYKLQLDKDLKKLDDNIADAFAVLHTHLN